MPYDIIIGRDEADRKKFGDRGLLSIGKGYVKMRQYYSLSNPIKLDVSRSHVILVAGKRGSGKSYTLGAIAEEISSLSDDAKKNIAPLIFDTMGIFWTMKYENEKDKVLLSSWDLKPRKLDVKVFVPFGFYDRFSEAGIPVDSSFSIKVSELGPEDWVLMFNLSVTDPISVLIERSIFSLSNKTDDYDLTNIIEEIRRDKNSSIEDKSAAVSLFEAAYTWGVFSSKGDKETLISDLLNPGITTILDLSMYNSVGKFNVRALVIGLLCRKIFRERMFTRKSEEIEAVKHGIDYLAYGSRKESPLVWIFIDEAHEFLPRNGETPATDSLVQVLREGRQPGISLVLATQQPGQIHRDVMTQSDIVISHRLTSQDDLSALNEMMQSYVYGSIKKHMDDLPDLKGSAILLDDNSERIYPIRVRPRYTWHGGESPSAVKAQKKL